MATITKAQMIELFHEVTRRQAELIVDTITGRVTVNDEDRGEVTREVLRAAMEHMNAHHQGTHWHEGACYDDDGKRVAGPSEFQRSWLPPNIERPS